MQNKILKNIYKTIKKYDTIVISRHIGADPDAIGSSVGLKEIILNTFPKKKVYVVGAPANRFKFLGELDRFNEDMYNNSLLIVTDTPDKRRVDGVDVNRFKSVIKIDHHPFIDDFGGIEWVDDTASSASQMVIELAFNTKLKMCKSAAEKLYLGLVADTNRFLFYYTTSKTFELVSKLIKDYKLEFYKLYDNLYTRPLKEIKFQSYIVNNFNITENGFAYCNITEEIINEYGVDVATAGNMVNNFNYIDEIIAWGLFSYDKNNNSIRGSVRSRGPIINSVLSNYGGGGHIYASGVRVKTFDEVEDIVDDLDKACLEYKESKNK